MSSDSQDGYYVLVADYCEFDILRKVGWMDDEPIGQSQRIRWAWCDSVPLHGQRIFSPNITRKIL